MDWMRKRRECPQCQDTLPAGNNGNRNQLVIGMMESFRQLGVINGEDLEDWEERKAAVQVPQPAVAAAPKAKANYPIFSANAGQQQSAAGDVVVLLDSDGEEEEEERGNDSSVEVIDLS